MWTYQETYQQPEAKLAQIYPVQKLDKNLKKVFIMLQKRPCHQKEMKSVEIIIKEIMCMNKK